MPGKQYTTAPILVNADGHPIPQYLDTTDTTDSPQGTFKPLTQLQAERSDVQNVQLTGSIGEDKDGLAHIKREVKNIDLIPFGQGVTIPPGQSYELGGQDVNDMISIACTIRLIGSPKYEVVLAYDAQGYNRRSVGLTVVIDNSETGRYADSGTVTNIPHAKFAFWRITNRDTEDITVDYFGERRFY